VIARATRLKRLRMLAPSPLVLAPTTPQNSRAYGASLGGYASRV